MNAHAFCPWSALKSRYAERSPARRRRIRAQLAAALLLLVLGCGNLLYGQSKQHEYRNLWRQATAQKGLAGLPKHLPMLAPTVDTDQDAQQITKLKSRLAYYEVVSLGGQCFMVVAAALLLYALALLYQPESPPGE